MKQDFRSQRFPETLPIRNPSGLVDTHLGHFGSLDIIVNNAGYTWDNVIQKTTDKQFQAMLDIHLVAPFRLLRAASEHIAPRRSVEKKRGKSSSAKWSTSRPSREPTGTPDRPAILPW